MVPKAKLDTAVIRGHQRKRSYQAMETENATIAAPMVIKQKIATNQGTMIAL